MTREELRELTVEVPAAEESIRTFIDAFEACNAGFLSGTGELGSTVRMFDTVALPHEGLVSRLLQSVSV